MYSTTYRATRPSPTYVPSKALLGDVFAIYIGFGVLSARPLPPIIAFGKRWGW